MKPRILSDCYIIYGHKFLSLNLTRWLSVWSTQSYLVDVCLDRVLPVAVAPHVALGRVRVHKVLHPVPVRPRLLAPPPAPPPARVASLGPLLVPAWNYFNDWFENSDLFPLLSPLRMRLSSLLQAESRPVQNDNKRKGKEIVKFKWCEWRSIKYCF